MRKKKAQQLKLGQEVCIRSDISSFPLVKGRLKRKLRKIFGTEALAPGKKYLVTGLIWIPDESSRSAIGSDHWVMITAKNKGRKVKIKTRENTVEDPQTLLPPSIFEPV